MWWNVWQLVGLWEVQCVWLRTQECVYTCTEVRRLGSWYIGISLEHVALPALMLATTTELRNCHFRSIVIIISFTNKCMHV